MPSNESCVALHLQAPLQSWGVCSQFSERDTGRFPSKSAISGMICAAFGYARGSEQERDLLEMLSQIKFLTVSTYGASPTSNVPGRLNDFHTVMGTRKANGGVKACHITRRHYLTDSEFYVFLSGNDELIHSIASAIKNPVWGLWLGRKCCIPSTPIFAGEYTSEVEALKRFFDQPIEHYSSCEDAVNSTVDDYAWDEPRSFESRKRIFEPRKVHINIGH